MNRTNLIKIVTMALLERHTDLVRKIVVREVAKNTRRGGRAHKMWVGQMISPKNGGSVDTIVNFWGECNSNVIFMGGVEIKLVDFGRKCGPVL